MQKKAKWLSEEALQIAVKREVKSTGEKERYKETENEVLKCQSRVLKTDIQER